MAEHALPGTRPPPAGLFSARGGLLKRGLRIGLRLHDVGTFDVNRPGNVQGDEQVARGWQKYLLRCDEVESVNLYPREGSIEESLDALIHFTPFGDEHPGIPNILYLQNAFPPDLFDGGTVGVFNENRDRFDGFLFTSFALAKACADGGVVPFATDPEIFFPQPDTQFAHEVAFVGNDIRGPVVNHRYFLPALPFGLVIYGNRAWHPPLDRACRGKIAAEDLPKLYSSALVNLNAHITEHVAWNTVNLRIYDILACGGFVISDRTRGLEDEFGEAVVCTDGEEELWAKLVRYLGDPQARRKFGENGRKLVFARHTYAERARTVLDFLCDIL